MKDKIGRDYVSLLLLQEQQLAQLQRVLQPHVYAELKDWCDIMNGPADVKFLDRNRNATKYTRGGLHSVPIGNELHEFIMDYGVSEQDAQLL